MTAASHEPQPPAFAPVIDRLGTGSRSGSSRPRTNPSRTARVLQVLGHLVGWLAGSVFRIRRAQVEHAMARAGIVDPSRQAAAMYGRLGVSLVEMLSTTGRNPSEQSVQSAALGAPSSDPSGAGGADGVGRVDLAELDRAIGGGPVVLFASHCENWELAAAAAARHLREQGRALHMVAKPMHSTFFDRWLARLRAERGVDVIAPGGAMSAAATALARGDVVAMPVDQVPDREAHGVWIDFLGAPALVDRAPATVAYLARATVLVLAGGRVLDVIPAADRSATDRTSWVLATTTRATAALEQHVLHDPASWMWLHRRWKRPPAA